MNLDARDSESILKKRKVKTWFNGLAREVLTG